KSCACNHERAEEDRRQEAFQPPHTHLTLPLSPPQTPHRARVGRLRLLVVTNSRKTCVRPPLPKRSDLPLPEARDGGVIGWAGCWLLSRVAFGDIAVLGWR